MTAFLQRGAQVPGNPGFSGAAVTLAGTDWLLSMVEMGWSTRNGDGKAMEMSDKARKELEKIEQQIVRLRAVPGQDPDTRGQIDQLNQRVGLLRDQLSQNPNRPKSAWEKAELARHPQRPYMLDYIERIFTDFSEIHGDRSFRDDHAMVCGMARFHGEEVLVVGQQKARDTKQKVYRNFGMPNPEGYRKALRTMKIAAKFQRPVICFVDTDGAYPGIDAEERGQGEAIARNLLEMSRLPVPVIVTVTGEGGSGGALAIAVGDRVNILENGFYSVISPEGCASIIWRDSTKAETAAVAMKITATDLKDQGIVDEIVPEPEGGAHTDVEGAARLLEEVLDRQLVELLNEPVKSLVAARYEKFRKMGQFFDLQA